MKNFQRKDKKKFMKLLETWPFLILLSVVLVFFAINIFHMSQKMLTTVKNKKNAELKYLELKESRERLEKDIERLNTEKGVEERIREEFGLAKEGEGLIVVVEDDTAVDTENLEKEGFFKSIFKKLKY